MEPQSLMEKVLYAVDELTGLVTTTVLVRPSRSVLDIPISRAAGPTIHGRKAARPCDAFVGGCQASANRSDFGELNAQCLARAHFIAADLYRCGWIGLDGYSGT